VRQVVNSEREIIFLENAIGIIFNVTKQLDYYTYAAILSTAAKNFDVDETPYLDFYKKKI